MCVCVAKWMFACFLHSRIRLLNNTKKVDKRNQKTKLQQELTRPHLSLSSSMPEAGRDRHQRNVDLGPDDDDDDGVHIPLHVSLLIAVNRFRRWAHRTISTPLWNIASLVLIAINAIALCCYTFEEGSALDAGLELVNQFCSVLFFIELAIRIAAVGWRPFVEPPWWDTLDLFAIVMSLPVFSSNLSSLRVLRFLLPLHFTADPAAALSLSASSSPSIVSLHIMTQTLINAIAPCLDVIGLAFIVVLLFATAAMQLFAELLPASLKWQHYRTLPDALVACLCTLLTGDWSLNVERQLWASSKTNLSNEAVIMVFHLSLATLGNWVIVALFLSVTATVYTDVSASHTSLLKGKSSADGDDLLHSSLHQHHIKKMTKDAVAWCNLPAVDGDGVPVAAFAKSFTTTGDVNKLEAEDPAICDALTRVPVLLWRQKKLAVYEEVAELQQWVEMKVLSRREMIVNMMKKQNTLSLDQRLFLWGKHLFEKQNCADVHHEHSEKERAEAAAASAFSTASSVVVSLAADMTRSSEKPGQDVARNSSNANENNSSATGASGIVTFKPSPIYIANVVRRFINGVLSHAITELILLFISMTASIVLVLDTAQDSKTAPFVWRAGQQQNVGDDRLWRSRILVQSSIVFATVAVLRVAVIALSKYVTSASSSSASGSPLSPLSSSFIAATATAAVDGIFAVDCGIALRAIFALILSNIDGNNNSTTIVSIIAESECLLRVLFLVRFIILFPPAADACVAAFRSVRFTLVLCLLSLLFTFVLSVVGRHVFGTLVVARSGSETIRMPPQSRVTELLSFEDGWLSSFYLCFIVLSGDIVLPYFRWCLNFLVDRNNVTFEAMSSFIPSGALTVLAFISAFCFVFSLYLVGRMFLVNILMVVSVEDLMAHRMLQDRLRASAALEDDEDEEEEDENDDEINKTHKFLLRQNKKISSMTDASVETWHSAISYMSGAVDEELPSLILPPAYIKSVRQFVHSPPPTALRRQNRMSSLKEKVTIVIETDLGQTMVLHDEPEVEEEVEPASSLAAAAAATQNGESNTGQAAEEMMLTIRQPTAAVERPSDSADTFMNSIRTVSSGPAGSDSDASSSNSEQPQHQQRQRSNDNYNDDDCDDVNIDERKPSAAADTMEGRNDGDDDDNNVHGEGQEDVFFSSSLTASPTHKAGKTVKFDTDFGEMMFSGEDLFASTGIKGDAPDVEVEVPVAASKKMSDGHENQLRALPSASLYELAEASSSSLSTSLLFWWYHPPFYPCHYSYISRFDKSLWLLTPDHPLRKLCLDIVHSPVYRWLGSCLLLVNAATFLFWPVEIAEGRDTLDENPVIWFLDLVCNVFFSAEIVLNAIAFTMFSSNQLRSIMTTHRFDPIDDRNSTLVRAGFVIPKDDAKNRFAAATETTTLRTISSPYCKCEVGTHISSKGDAIHYSYLSDDIMNVLDTIGRLGSLLGNFVPVLRFFRILRSARLMTPFPEAKRIFVALCRALPIAVLRFAPIGIIVYVVVAVIGVETLQGQLMQSPTRRAAFNCDSVPECLLFCYVVAGYASTSNMLFYTVSAGRLGGVFVILCYFATTVFASSAFCGVLMAYLLEDAKHLAQMRQWPAEARRAVALRGVLRSLLREPNELQPPPRTRPLALFLHRFMTFSPADLSNICVFISHSYDYTAPSSSAKNEATVQHKIQQFSAPKITGYLSLAPAASLWTHKSTQQQQRRQDKISSRNKRDLSPASLPRVAVAPMAAAAAAAEEEAENSSNLSLFDIWCVMTIIANFVAIHLPDAAARTLVLKLCLAAYLVELLLKLFVYHEALLQFGFHSAASDFLLDIIATVFLSLHIMDVHQFLGALCFLRVVHLRKVMSRRVGVFKLLDALLQPNVVRNVAGGLLVLGFGVFVFAVLGVFLFHDTVTPVIDFVPRQQQQQQQQFVTNNSTNSSTSTSNTTSIVVNIDKLDVDAVGWTTPYRNFNTTIRALKLVFDAASPDTWIGFATDYAVGYTAASRSTSGASTADVLATPPFLGTLPSGIDINLETAEAAAAAAAAQKKSEESNDDNSTATTKQPSQSSSPSSVSAPTVASWASRRHPRALVFSYFVVMYGLLGILGPSLTGTVLYAELNQVEDGPDEEEARQAAATDEDDEGGASSTSAGCDRSSSSSNLIHVLTAVTRQWLRRTTSLTMPCDLVLEKLLPSLPHKLTGLSELDSAANSNLVRSSRRTRRLLRFLLNVPIPLIHQVSSTSSSGENNSAGNNSSPFLVSADMLLVSITAWKMSLCRPDILAAVFGDKVLPLGEHLLGENNNVDKSQEQCLCLSHYFAAQVIWRAWKRSKQGSRMEKGGRGELFS